MEANKYSDIDGPAPKKLKYSPDHTLLHLFVDYVAAKESDAHTPEEIRECVESLKRKTISTMTPFQEDVKKKLKHLLPILLACNEDVNFVGRGDQTILHIFVMQYTDRSSTKEVDWSKDRKIVKTLLEKGASVDIVNLTENTPIHYAVSNQRSDLVQLMLGNCTNVNAQNSCGSTALHGLIDSYKEKPNDFDIEIIRTLISKGANYSTRPKESKMSPLDVAIKYGLIQVLMAFKINEAESEKLLLFVSQSADQWSNYPEELQYLDRVVDLSKSVHLRTEKDRLTPMHYVSKFGRKDAVEMFVNSGANINAVTIDGMTPLHLAVMYGHHDVVKFLIKCGTNLHARDNIFDFGLMHFATCTGNKDIVNLLIEMGLDVNDQSRDGIKPLHLAAMKGDEWTIKRFISQGADVNCRTREKQLTPLHLIVANKVDICNEISTRNERLIYQGFSFARTHPQARPEECISLMIQVGAHVNARDSEFRTPLYHVLDQLLNVAIDVQSISQTLLKHGARVDVQDANKRPIMRIKKSILNAYGLKELLIYGANINDVDYIEIDYYNEHYYTPSQHLRLMQAIGLPIKDRHKSDIEKQDREINRPPPIIAGRERLVERLNTNFNQRNARRDRFKENLNIEVAKIKTHHLSDGETSLYDFLHMNSKHRLKFAQDVLSLDLESEYPLYHIVIENSCRRAINEKSIVSLASATLKQLIQLDIPDVCTGKIFNFMSLPEMTAFIDIVESFTL